MRVAIVGAGLAGLAVCWHLCQYSGVQVVLFDSKGIGGGTSGVSAGLLHPFPGRRAARSWESQEGMRAALRLIAVSEQALGRSVAQKNGLFRPVITAQQKQDFTLCAQKNSDAAWLEHPCFGQGLWVESGMTVYSTLYLQGLWMASRALGAEFVEMTVKDPEELFGFDRVVLTAGFETLQFRACKQLPLSMTKGQTLICRAPEPLACSLASQGHITPTEDACIFQVGSTYEHNYTSLSPESSVALTLQQKVAQFYPDALDFEVLDIRAGVRIARIQGYLPIVRKLDLKTWLFTGLGSRGLLYHALIGEALAASVALDRGCLEPKERFAVLFD